MPSADTDTPLPALFAQLLSPVGFDTLLGQYSLVAATSYWRYGHRSGRSGIRCEYVPVRSTKSSLILTIPDRP